MVRLNPSGQSALTTFLLLILAVALLGHITGLAIRKARLRKIRKSHIQKPLYKIQDDLSPAEFGCIIDGTVGYKELVGEILLLAMQGQVVFTRQPSGKFSVSKTYQAPTNLTPIQRAIMQHLAADTDTYALQADLEYATKQSLVQKGWIVQKKQPLRALSDLPPRYILAALELGLGILLAAVLIASLLGAEGTAMYGTVVFTITAEIFLGLIAGFGLVYRGELMAGGQFLMVATTKYEQQWSDVYGVYEYIRISGMDVFTPDYETMDLHGLDPLYPYAVAAGLDKRVVKVIA